MADWIARVVAKRAPNAVRCADPFHVVPGRSKRSTSNAPSLERSRRTAQRTGTNRYARHRQRRRHPIRSAEPATPCGRTPTTSPTANDHQLDWIAKTDPRLWRAYLLKEGLRYVFAVKGDEGKEALDRWLAGPTITTPRLRRTRTQRITSQPRRDRRHPRLAASPTGSSSPPTPRSDSSPASPSASTDPNPSSPSPCSPSAPNHPDYPAETDPRIIAGEPHKCRSRAHAEAGLER